MRRISTQNKTFGNYYDLAAFTYDSILKSDNEPVMGRVDMQLRFLQLVKLAQPKVFHKYVESLDLSDEQRLISEQVIDIILAEKLIYHEQFQQAKQEIMLKNPYLSTEE